MTCHLVRSAKNFAVSAAFGAILVCLALGTGNAVAQTVTAYQEGGRLMRGAEEPTALGSQLFGDKFSAYTGSVEFIQTDVSIPGNSTLPVAIGRRFKPGGGHSSAWHFRDWEIDIPFIKVLVPSRVGWYVDTGVPSDRGRRCTHYAQEIAPAPMAQGTASAVVGAANAYLNIPGQTQQEIQSRSPYFSVAPTGGSEHPAVTKEGWQFSCLPSLAPGSLGTGEGFLARSPDGTTYRFDWMVSRPKDQIQARAAKEGFDFSVSPPSAPRRWLSNALEFIGVRAPEDPGVQMDTGVLLRDEVLLMVTRVTDAFGNHVQYTYSPSTPWRLTRIEASDGRYLNLSYYTSANEEGVQSVSDGQRTWIYSYSNGQLVEVRQPDGNSWRFSGDDTLRTPAWGASYTQSRYMSHPSGAMARFDFRAFDFQRSFVAPWNWTLPVPNVTSRP